jgi:hypothetical protein
VCGKSGPKSQVRLIKGTLAWWTVLTMWWGKMLVVKAPACPFCAWKLQGLRALGLAVTVAGMVAIVWLDGPQLKGVVPPGLQKWVLAGLALACLVPQLVFETFYARPFDVTAYDDSVTYEFTSADYALEFVLLNASAAWSKVNGRQFDHANWMSRIEQSIVER